MSTTLHRTSRPLEAVFLGEDGEPLEPARLLPAGSLVELKHVEPADPSVGIRNAEALLLTETGEYALLFLSDPLELFDHQEPNDDYTAVVTHPGILQEIG